MGGLYCAVVSTDLSGQSAFLKARTIRFSSERPTVLDFLCIHPFSDGNDASDDFSRCCSCITSTIR